MYNNQDFFIKEVLNNFSKILKLFLIFIILFIFCGNAIVQLDFQKSYKEIKSGDSKGTNKQFYGCIQTIHGLKCKFQNEK